MAHLDSAFAPAAEAAPEAAAGARAGEAAAAGASDPSIVMGPIEEGAAPLLKQEQLDAVEDGSDPAPPPTAACTSFSSASSVSSSTGAGIHEAPGQQQQQQQQDEGGGPVAIRPFSRPGFVRRAGYQSKGTRWRLPRVFPSSLVVNAQRAEALFQKHYREQAAAAAGGPLPGLGGAAAVDGTAAGVGGGGVAGEQGLGLRRESRRKHQQHLALGGRWEGGDSGSVSSAPSSAKHHEGSKRGGQKEQQQQQLPAQPQLPKEQRQEEARGAGAGVGRTTRSRTGKGVMDDWIKVPVTVMGRIGAAGEMAPVDGVVYVSMENGRLFKQQGLVFFEGTWQGQKHKCLVEEAELPMISESHPAFRAEAARAEEERGKKTDKARHMLELVCANEEAAFDMERKAADRTLELRRVELKERMLERVEDELEELRAALEEAEAIGSLAAIRGPAPAPAPQQQQQPAPDDSKQPAEVAAAAEPEPGALTVSVPASGAAGEAPAPATTGRLSAAWNGMEEELQRDPSPDPFALDQPLLAFEALMDGMGGMDGMGLPGLMEVDEEVEQASAGPASRSSSSSASTPAVAPARAGASAPGANAEAREEKKSGDDAVHKSAAGEAAAAAAGAGGAGVGVEAAAAAVVWECGVCTFSNKGGVARCGMCTTRREDAAVVPNVVASTDAQPTAEQAKEEGAAASALVPASAEAAAAVAAATLEASEQQGALPPPKKRKINAADLAMQTLALASDIQKGRTEVGYVREAEYEDIHDVFMERLHPDPQFGEDEDLCLW